MALLFVVDRADGAEAQSEWSGLGRGQECFLPVAVLARSSQFKVVVKPVPEFAEF